MFSEKIHADITYKKSHQRLHFLRKLRNFNVDKTLLTLFYQSFIQSVITFSIVCWYGNLNKNDTARLQRTINTASRIIGSQQPSLAKLYDKFVLSKTRSILADKAHPLFSQYELLPSARRYRAVSCKTNRRKLSFIPASITALNRQLQKV